MLEVYLDYNASVHGVVKRAQQRVGWAKFCSC